MEGLLLLYGSRTLKNGKTAVIVKSISAVMFVIFLVCFQNLAVEAIQNTPTYLASSSQADQHVILSGSSFNNDKTVSTAPAAAPAAAAPKDQHLLANNFKTIESTLQHKSFKNIDRFKKSVTADDDNDDDDDDHHHHSSPLKDIHNSHNIEWDSQIITSSKHFVNDIEGNNIEVKPAEYFDIKPTKELRVSGEDEGAPQRQLAVIMPEPLNQHHHHHHHHQLTGLIQQRQSRQEIPRIYSSSSNRTLLLGMQTPAIGNRQANPDIQDIITGIVKLLNGNVNVAANTIRPHKPAQPTRINNRGPPRISDLPPLLPPPDFDTPGMNPPPPAATATAAAAAAAQNNHPYPFEKPSDLLERPTSSINNNQLLLLPPIKEKPAAAAAAAAYNTIISSLSTPEPNQDPLNNNKPWTRPFKQRPPPVNDNHYQQQQPPHLHPNTPYNPILIPDGENYYFIDNKGTTLKPENTSINNKQVTTTTTEEIITTTKKKPSKYQPPLQQNKKINDNTLILGSDIEPIPILTQSEILKNSLNVMTTATTEFNSLESSTTTMTTTNNHHHQLVDDINTTITTLKIETSSSINIIEPTKTVINVKPSMVVHHHHHPLENIDSISTFIEPSTVSIVDLTYSSSSNTHHNLISTPTTAFVNSNSISTVPLYENSASSNNYRYRPRPGIVLDDTLDYTKSPAGLVVTQRPHHHHHYHHHQPPPPPPPSRHPPIVGDIFDITVSAVQGPNGGGGGSDGDNVIRVSLNPIAATAADAGSKTDIILTSAIDGQRFVSIDGKRTYLNLFDNSDGEQNTPPPSPSSVVVTKVQIHPTTRSSQIFINTVTASTGGGGGGGGFADVDINLISARPTAAISGAVGGGGGGGGSHPIIKRPILRHHRTTQPPVRIDTCIVGETTTCDASQNEACATVQGVSACHCKPGFARHSHSLLCKKVVSIVVSIRVDRIYDWKIIWSQDFTDKESEIYQTIAFETNKAIESAMSMTPFSDEYISSSINNLFQGLASEGRGGVFVNATLKLVYEARTARPTLASELQKHLLGVLNRRNNNIGNSAVFVESASGAISSLQDLDECASSELNDCNASAVCTNNWGGFTCSCKQGFKDPHKDDPNKIGRFCLSCPSTHCNNRGICSYQDNNIRQCSCTGNYYGTQCEIDGEVLGVSIGATVGAIIVIILTIVGLFMWSRGLQSRDQKPVGGSPVYGYMQHGGIPAGTYPAGTLARVGSVGTLASIKQQQQQQGPPHNLPPYLWGHITERMAATANLYATEPLGPTRPSSAVFGGGGGGYPTLNCHGTLPPVPLPRLQAPLPPPSARPAVIARQQRYQPESADSSDSEQQDKDRADLIPTSNGFHVPRPKSRSSLANQSGIYYDVEYDQGDAQHLSKNNIQMTTYARPYYRT